MSKKLNFIFLLFCFCSITYYGTAQTLSPVAQEVQNAKASGQKFQPVNFFQTLKANEVDALESRNLPIDNAVYFNYEKVGNFKQILDNNNSLSITIPGDNRNQGMVLELVEVDIYSGDFRTNLSTFTPGKHYRGVVKDSKNSLVAMSFFEEEVIGLVVQNGNTFTLGKVKDEQKVHILYNEFEQGWDLGLNCNVDDSNISFDPHEVANSSLTRAPDDCIRERFDVDESLTNWLGGVTQATNYATGVFNNHKTLCTNDDINVLLSELVVWSNANPAPFIIDEYNTLDSYRAETDTYNGDVAYLGFYQGGWGGGVASAIGGICPFNVDDSKAVGGHYGTYNEVPLYSHDVMLISHELGHLFGARHTHACVWNGNNTAIDGCSGFTEGSCPVPTYAPNAGTIMSYCNINDFNEGFHPQVAQAIRDYIATRTCTSACGGNTSTCTDGIQNGDETGVDCGGSCPPCTDPPTCNDGIQNGDETGIDCGGSCPPCTDPPTCTDGIQNGDETGVDCGGSCPPCTDPSTCNDGIQNGDETGVDCGGSCPPCGNVDCMDNAFILTLTLDNYPKETTWDVRDENGAIVVSSNGHYGAQANGATITEDICLINGCYTFSIYDHFGDGICCEYGEGAYLLLDANGETIAQGGDFGSVESSEFCVEDGETPEPEYCKSKGMDTSFEWIESVKFGSIDNHSGNNQGYGDFTNISTTLVGGSTIGISLVPGFDTYIFEENWRIWIDFNQDGDFEDDGELLVEGVGAGIQSGFLTIPTIASTGNTRMRVSMQYFFSPEPCDIFRYGEVEDYTVMLVPGFIDPNDQNPINNQLSDDGTEASNGVKLSPNPSDKIVHLEYLAREKGEINITLMNASGQSVLKKQEAISIGNNSFYLETQSLPNGIYMLVINHGKRQHIKRLTVIH